MPLPSPTALAQALTRRGLPCEALDDAVMVPFEQSTVLLIGGEGGYRLHLDLNVYVEHPALFEVLLGVNALNLSLERGHLALDLHEPEDEGDPGGEEGSSYQIIGRGQHPLPPPEDLGDLATFVQEFERELRGAVEDLFLEGAGETPGGIEA